MDAGTAIVLAAVATSLPGTIAAITARQAKKAVAVVDKKVDYAVMGIDTLNGSTMGELASSDETRRIEAIPFPERTVKEQVHMDEAPPPDPPQGPRR